MQIKAKLAFFITLLAIGLLLPMSAMALSDSDKAVIKLTVSTALNGSGNFNYVKSEIDDENNLEIWYVPKNTDSNATVSALGLVIGSYLGATGSYPDISDAYIFIGTQEDEKGSFSCLRSWISNGEMTDEELTTLVLKVLETFKDLS
ncbi:MAG: hypothetical protein M0Q13_06860 [Methanothrix sp.]|nr:hypothetical protein [Methanothrix sp.]